MYKLEKYEKAFVAFIDILGFSSIIKNISISKNKDDEINFIYNYYII